MYYHPKRMIMIVFNWDKRKHSLTMKPNWWILLITYGRRPSHFFDIFDFVCIRIYSDSNNVKSSNLEMSYIIQWIQWWANQIDEGHSFLYFHRLSFIVYTHWYARQLKAHWPQFISTKQHCMYVVRYKHSTSLDISIIDSLDVRWRKVFKNKLKYKKKKYEVLKCMELNWCSSSCMHFL
jgi:hypothetical protein